MEPSSSTSSTESNSLESNSAEIQSAEMNAGETTANALAIVAQGTPEVKRPPVQVQIKQQDGKLVVILPSQAQTDANTSWSELWEQFKHRLNGGDRFWPTHGEVHLNAQDRLLDNRQLKTIADALTEAELQLKLVQTSRRQTAVAAAANGYSVEQIQSKPGLESVLGEKTAETSKAMADPLYLQITIRSGVEIRHPGSVIVLGDVNPGGSIVAAGDIIVLGRLRGFTHAGSEGNTQAVILALQMEPTQLRIADVVARAPEQILDEFYAEVAYVTPDGIRIARATDFMRTHAHRWNSLPSDVAIGS